MSETALSYIQSKGLEYKEQAGQILLKVCPYCGDQKRHFYMDPGEGVFYCHKCQARGNLFTLMKHFGDFDRQEGNRMQNVVRRPTEGIQKAFSDKSKACPLPDEKKFIQAHQMLLNDPEALAYVTGTRGISIEAVKHFRLGLQVDQAGDRWLTIPHFQGGHLVNVKSRSLPPLEKTFRRVKDCRSILFNGDSVKVDPEEVFITEGELDAISLWGRGFKNVVSSTTGAGSFDPSWIDQLAKVSKVFIVYDPDEAGQKGARELARRLGYGRSFNVVMPYGHDVNEFFCAGYNAQDFKNLLEAAKPFDVAGIMSFGDAIEEFNKERTKPERETGIKTGWPSVDRLIKTGFRPGELIVLSAPPKIGKSTFALQMVTRTALQKIPSLFFCLEMRIREIVRKIVQGHRRTEDPDQEDIDRTRKAFQDAPLFLGYSYQKPTLEGIMETLKAAVKRYGLKLMVFDHLHFLCRSISNQVQEVGLAVQAFKFLAEEMEIPIILIAQPRKTQTDEIMTAMDLKDSASIFSDCDHLLILHRNRQASTKKAFEAGKPLQEKAFSPLTLVRVEASRFNRGGETLLYFHGESSRFVEIKESGQGQDHNDGINRWINMTK